MRRFFNLLTIFFLFLAPLQAGLGTLEGSSAFSLNKRKFLSPEEAFKVDAGVKDDAIVATIKLGDKIHIYAKDLKFSVVKPEKIPLKAELPAPVKYEGDDVYYGTVEARIPLEQIRGKVDGPFTLQVDLSGCSDSGICYAPQKYAFDLPAVAGAESEKPKAESSKPTPLNAQPSTLTPSSNTQHPTPNTQHLSPNIRRNVPKPLLLFA